MNFRLIAYLVAALVVYLGLSMCLPLLIALYYDDGSAVAILISLLATCGLGGGVFLLTRGHQDFFLSHRDGVAIVTLGWMVAGLAATLPYLLSGAIPTFTDAYFESMSGFTTTGASILTNIEQSASGDSLLARPDPVAGGDGNHCSLHRHSSLPRYRRDAAL